MSLASHFKKKSVQRKSRANLSISIKPDTGEMEQVSIECKKKLKNHPVETANNPTKPVLENSKGFTFDAKNPSGENDKSNLEVAAEFTFGFDLGDDITNAKSKSRKRRTRRKTKKKIETADTNEEPNMNLTSDDDINGNRSYSLSTGDNATLRIDECSYQPDKVTQTPTKAAHAISSLRTPPGFCSHDNIRSNLGAIASVDSLPSRPLRKTPGKMGNKLHHTQFQSFEQNSTLLKEPEPIPEERTMQFNTADKGHAMVNHSSLAVRRERTEERIDDPDDHNAFSFGFSFESLLKDYL